jgi:hypothetical protein
MTILIWISVLSFFVISTMIGTRLLAIRGGKIAVLEQPTLFSFLQEKIDWMAVLFVLIFREGLKFVSLHTLLSIKKGVSHLKVASIKVEKRFSRVIDLVHGKGAVSKKGAVSFFLREIKDHNDKVKAQSN